MEKKRREEKERLMIFIDGSNFYYSTSRKGIKVDFEKLIKELSTGKEFIGAYYYVAPLDINEGEEKYWAHQRFLEKLKKISNFNVILCSLKKIKIDGKYKYFVKGDDVKLSNNLLMGAVEDNYDVAIIVSGDEDFVDSVKIVREKYGKKVGNAYFGRSSSSNLRRECNFIINLDKILGKITYNKKENDESSVLSEDHTEH